MQKYKESNDQLDNVLKINPKYYQALHKKGVILLKIAENSKSVYGKSNLLNYDSSCLELLYNQSLSLFSQGMYQNSLEKLTYILKLQPQYFDALYLKSICLSFVGKYEDSIQQFKKILRQNPDHQESVAKIGGLLLRQQKYSEALNQLNFKSINFESELNLGVTLLLLEKFKEANKQFESLYIKTKSDYYLIHFFQGICLFKMNQFHQALKSFQLALEKNPKHFESQFGKCICLYELNCNQESLEQLDVLIKLNQNHFSSYIWKGFVLKKVGKWQEAQSCFKRAEEIQSKSFLKLLDFNNLKNLTEAILDKLDCFKESIHISLITISFLFQSQEFLFMNQNILKSKDDSKKTSLIKLSKKVCDQNRDVQENNIAIEQIISNYKASLQQFNMTRQLYKDYSKTNFYVGQILYNLGDFEKALNICEQILENTKGKLSIKTLFLKAICLFKQGLFQKSQKIFQQLQEEVNVKEQQFHFYYGVCLSRQGKFKESIDCFQSVLNNHPNHELAFYNKCYSLNQLGKLKNSLDWVDYLIAQKPEVGHLYLKSQILSNLGEINESNDCLDLILKQNQGYLVDSINLKANNLINIGQFEKSLEHIDQFVQLSPNNILLQIYKGVALFRICQYQSSIQQFELIKNLEPDCIQFQYFIGLCLKQSGDINASISTLDNLVNQEKFKFEILQQKGECLFIIERFEDSNQQFKKMQQIEPENIILNYFISRNLGQMEKYKEALKFIEKVLKQNQQHFQALSKKADQLNFMCNYKESSNVLEQAFQINKTNYNCLYKLGITLFHLQQYEKCIKYFEEALQINTDDFSCFYQKALSFIQLKQYQEAKLNLEKALQINPTHIQALKELTSSKFSEFQQYKIQ